MTEVILFQKSRFIFKHLFSVVVAVAHLPPKKRGKKSSFTKGKLLRVYTFVSGKTPCERGSPGFRAPCRATEPVRSCESMGGAVGNTFFPKKKKKSPPEKSREMFL